MCLLNMKALGPKGFDDVHASIFTSPLGIGGHDIIGAGNGDNIVLAGFGNDSVTTGSGSDTVIADNGLATFTNGIRSSVTTTDSFGGDDNIFLGAGNDEAIGGVGKDTIEASDGINVILGDNGLIESDAEGLYTFLSTGDTSLGDNDTIIGGDSHDVILGGVGSDILFGNAGDDFLQGDGGTMSRDGLDVDFVSIDLFTGGSDTVDGGDGNDVLVAGFESDVLVGSLTEDVLVGEYARVVGVLDDNYSIVSIDDLNTLAQGPLDLIRSTQMGVYENYETVDEAFVLELLNTLTDASGDTDTGAGFALDEDNPLSDTSLIEGWAEINERYGFFTPAGTNQDGDSQDLPFEVMINPESGDVIILDEGSDTDAGEQDVEEADTTAEESPQNNTNGEGSDEIISDEGSDAVNGEGEENQDTSQGASEQPEETDEEVNEDQTINEEEGVVKLVASAATGWGVLGAIGQTTRTNSRLDLADVEKIKSKRKYLRWDDVNC
jgi:hypothetical protein